jgi:hypothetical protein
VTSATEAMLRPPHRLPFTTKRQIGMFLIYGVGAAIAGLLASRGAWLAFLPFVAVAGSAGFHYLAGLRNGSRTRNSASSLGSPRFCRRALWPR